MPQSQAAAIENMVSSFKDDLTTILADARREVIRLLMDRLSVVDGRVAKTKSNMRVLQQVDDIFQRAMDRAGYRRAVNTYVAKFNGQFEYFQQTLDRLGKQIGQDLKLDFGKRDRALFVQQQVSATRLIDAVVDTVAASAERQAMLAVGGMRLGQLIDAIVVKLDSTVPQAMTLADTALSTFYRTIADRGYRIVERDLPDDMVLKYRYGGPDDKLTRPLCHLWLRQTADGKLWTRADIDALINGQLPNVFLTCGGFNCRHQWLVVALERV